MVTFSRKVTCMLNIVTSTKYAITLLESICTQQNKNMETTTLIIYNLSTILQPVQNKLTTVQL